MHAVRGLLSSAYHHPLHIIFLSFLPYRCTRLNREHAYYLDYKNKRAAYVKSFWNVVNWAVVSRRYEEAVAKWGVVDPKDEVPPGFKSSASDENSLFGAFFDQFGDVSRGASGGDVEVEISVAGAGGAVGAAGSVPVLSSDDGGLAELMKEFEAMRQEAEAEAAKAQAEAEAAKAAAAEAAAKAQAAEAAVSKPEAAAKTAEAAVPRAAAAVEPVAEAAVPAPQEQPAAPAQAEAAAAPPAQEQPQQQAAPATPTPAATSEKKKGSKGSKKASKAK